MLKGINKLLFGDLLKSLCDMGHGDTLVIADANFPAESVGPMVIHMPGLDGVTVLKAILSVFPIDTYDDEPVRVMELTDGDKEKGMKEPEIWKDYEELCGPLTRVERMDFYEQASNAYVIIQTGEERQYGNLLLTKGVIL